MAFLRLELGYQLTCFNVDAIASHEGCHDIPERQCIGMHLQGYPAITHKSHRNTIPVIAIDPNTMASLKKAASVSEAPKA